MVASSVLLLRQSSEVSSTRQSHQGPGFIFHLSEELYARWRPGVPIRCSASTSEQERDGRTIVGIWGTDGPPSSRTPLGEDLINMSRRSTSFLPEMAGFESGTRSRQVY